MTTTRSNGRARYTSGGIESTPADVQQRSPARPDTTSNMCNTGRDLPSRLILQAAECKASKRFCCTTLLLESSENLLFPWSQAASFHRCRLSVKRPFTRRNVGVHFIALLLLIARNFCSFRCFLKAFLDFRMLLTAAIRLSPVELATSSLTLRFGSPGSSCSHALSVELDALRDLGDGSLQLCQ